MPRPHYTNCNAAPKGQQPQALPVMSDPKPIVYVVEDDDLARNMIIALIESIGGLTCEPCANATAFLDNFNTNQPGCLVLDNFMPGMSGLQLQTELNRRGAIIPVIFVTVNANIPDVVAAMRQGAFNYLLKPFGKAELLTNIRRAIAYDGLNRQTLAQIDRIHERIASLTSREREVLELLAGGCANDRTIELHPSRLMEKMGADSLAQLVRMFIDFQQRAGHSH